MSSSTACSVPVTTLQYRDISGGKSRNGEAPAQGTEAGGESRWGRKGGDLSESELAERIARERASAASETEQKLRKEYEQKLLAARAPMAAAIAGFEEQRDQYFAQVEAEVVKLALAIAAKILHREAQVDPMLVAALVRLAMENMREGSSVTVRVGPGKGESWRRYFAGTTTVSRIEIAEDPQLNGQDCVVETELGSADFGLDKQLKEVEQGFFDLLALRPTNQ
ncbi:MAG: FliH/SctL family protein [Terracidiphilus sp.]